MGVYKSLDDVPRHHRLGHYVESYAGRDVWAEFVEANRDRYASERSREDSRRIERRWKDHMADRGRHHALARPEDVETWIVWLLDRMKPSTAYNPYWVRLEALYDWLLWHRDHPHVYNPVLMAAAEGPAAGEVWAEKIATNDGR